MLGLLNARLRNQPKDEIKIAMAEQDKITRLRLEKLFALMSQITSHVLDTSKGKPAMGIPVITISI